MAAWHADPDTRRRAEHVHLLIRRGDGCWVSRRVRWPVAHQSTLVTRRQMVQAVATSSEQQKAGDEPGPRAAIVRDWLVALGWRGVCLVRSRLVVIRVAEEPAEDRPLSKEMDLRLVAVIGERGRP